MIPFVDLRAQYLAIKDEIDKAISECIDSTSFIRGRAVGDFERSFAGYLGLEYCAGCGNGTDALEIILKSLGIGTGDEVLVPALTWISTAEAVNNVGAEPVFVDVDAETFTIDVSRLEDKISPVTKAIIPVHLYGCPADMDSVMKIAKKHNLYVIEDCAQAHGAEYKGRKTGTFGIASAFSFFPGKNLGAYGDAGAVVTNDSYIYEKVCRLTNHGQLKKKHEHSVIGRNSRLDTLQASILGAKLPHLDAWNNKRIITAKYYREKLGKNNRLILPFAKAGLKHVYHLFVIRVNNRMDLTGIFEKNDIQYGIHYPQPLPFVEAYRYKNHLPEDFPVATELTGEILSLPIYPEIKEDQIDLICRLINENT